MKEKFTIAHMAPDPALLDRIVFAIHRKREQSRLWRVRIFAGTAVASIAALVPVVISLVQTIISSRLGIYLSLLFTDGSTLWKEIGISLIESLPALTITIAVALIGVVLWSVRLMVRFMNSSSSSLAV